MTKEEKKEYMKKYRETNKENLKEKSKKYKEEHKEFVMSLSHDWYAKNGRSEEYRAKRKIYKEKYWIENKEKIKEKNKKYAEEHKKERNVYLKKYRKEREEKDTAYKIMNRLRHRIRESVVNKWDTTKNLVGCSAEELLKYLESKFQEGMSFNNYGKWHIDHIRPCASFNLVNEEEQKICFHYTNLQPLWAKDNMRKGSKWAGKDNYVEKK